MDQKKAFHKGRGAQHNPQNPFHHQHTVQEHHEGIDTYDEEELRTEIVIDYPKKIINKVDSPDLGMMYSLNPYQGCEHGCAYCYARNAHFYWGYSAGKDFESKIIVKPEAAALLRNELANPNWKPNTIVLSGNTDCYQPLERKYRLTRSLLEVFDDCRHPVGIITKNALILRDLDLLKSLNEDQLVHVSISLTTLNEALRRKLEPRTASGKARLKVIETLSKANIPVNVMTAPIIPGLNDYELPELLKSAAAAGARTAAYTMVRLNGVLPAIFEAWIRKAFPLKADRVLNNIKSTHEGKLNESRFGVRMRGKGPMAEQVRQMFGISYKKYFSSAKSIPPYNLEAFKRPGKNGQLTMF